MKKLFKRIGWLLVETLVARRPTDGFLIDELTNSFGHLWFTEPPMYDCYCEVTDVEQKGLNITAHINHVTMNLDDVEELFSEEKICGTQWAYTLEIKFNLKKREWEWVDSELITNGETQIWIDEASDPERCYETIFSNIDWDEYLYEHGITSDELMARFAPQYRAFYEDHHNRITENS